MTAPDLRALAEAALDLRCGLIDWTAYREATPPDVILALLDEIDALRDVAETALQNTLTVMADDMRLRTPT